MSTTLSSGRRKRKKKKKTTAQSSSSSCQFGLGKLPEICKERTMTYTIKKNKKIHILSQDTYLDPELDKYITAEWGFIFFFLLIIQNLEVWPYFSMTLLISGSKGYIRTI